MTPSEVAAAVPVLRPLAVHWAASYVPAQDAEDVAHAALVLLVERASDVEHGAVERFLRSCIWKTASTHRRRHGREVLTGGGDAYSRERSPAPDPEDTLVSAQLSTAVREAMGRLAASRRTILQEVELEGRPLAEVAREQEVPESTARARLGAATEQLQEDLHRQRVAEKRRTGGSSSWAFLPAWLDMRAGWRRALGVFGAAAAVVGALVYMSPEQLGPTPEEPLARAAEVEPLRLATPLPAAESGADRSVAPAEAAPRSRARHDVGARMLAERLRRPQ